MWYKAILENGGTWEPVFDCYKNQQILEKAVDSETCINICLATLKFIPDSIATRKMLEKLDNDSHAYDDIPFYNQDFDKVRLIANQILNK